MIPLLILGGFQPFWAGFIAPLFFGVAHGHHAYQFIFHDKVPVARVLLSVTFQFVYTTLFGWYSAYLFIQTNSVLPPTIAHCFCNTMGFPDFGSIPSSPRKIRTFCKLSFLICTETYIANLELSIVYVVGLGTYLTLLFLNPSWLFWRQWNNLVMCSTLWRLRIHLLQLTSILSPSRHFSNLYIKEESPSKEGIETGQDNGQAIEHKARFGHIFHREHTRSERDSIRGRGHWEHKGHWRRNSARNHQQQRVLTKSHGQSTNNRKEDRTHSSIWGQLCIQPTSSVHERASELRYTYRSRTWWLCRRGTPPEWDSKIQRIQKP